MKINKTMINIFKDGPSIDLPTFINTRALICANCGGGKSYAVRKILEESHGKVMSFILDIEGEFKTLREKYDFLLIGDDGDVKLNMDAAKLLPKKLLELNVSTIIDLSELKRSDRILYVKRFLDALMECPRKLWKPCIVVLDEAHILAGQQEKQISVSSVIDLMTRGRKRGYCGVLCTQRISKLHKDAVAECNNVMIGRTGLDIDMKRASEILGFTSKLDMLSLRDLDEGEFYVFGTAISKKVTKAKVDRVKTTHPKVGMDLKERIVPPTPKIKGILSELNELPKKATEELKSLGDLKRKVKQLEFELNRKTQAIKPVKPLKPVIDQRSIERAKQAGHNLGMIEAKVTHDELMKLTRNLLIAIKKISMSINNFQDIDLKALQLDLSNIKPLQAPKFSNYKIREKSYIPEMNNPSRNDIQNSTDSIMNKCAKRIYSFLYSNPNKAFSKVQLGLVTGYSHKSGGFNNALSNLNSNNLITKQGTLIVVGDSNPDLVIDGNQKLSVQYWFSKLGKCPGAIFKILLDNPNTLYSKDDLGEVTGYSPYSGGFNNSLSKLNTLEIIKKEGTMIKLNPEILELET